MNVVNAPVPAPVSGANTQPHFSVCIPAYNDLPAFRRCLDSVLNQQNVSLECVVSDDSTTDAIETYVAAHAAGPDDKRVHYSRNSVRLGPTANWNRAVGLAQGTYVALLHQDDWYRSEHALHEILTVFAREGADVLFCGRVLYRDGKPLAEYVTTTSAVANFRHRFPGITLVRNTLGTPSVAFFHQRHTAVRYDTALLYFSDTDYFARLLAAADKTSVCGSPHIGISLSDTQISAGCLARLDTLVPELAHGLRKHQAAARECGLALALFFAANLRHWRPATLSAALRQTREHFSFVVLCVFAASFPVVFVCMACRFACRRATGRVWE